VCRKKIFDRAVQTFAASLPPYGASFAALQQEFCSALVPSTNKQSAVQKSVAFSLDGGGWMGWV